MDTSLFPLKALSLAEYSEDISSYCFDFDVPMYHTEEIQENTVSTTVSSMLTDSNLYIVDNQDQDLLEIDTRCVKEFLDSETVSAILESLDRTETQPVSMSIEKIIGSICNSFEVNLSKKSLDNVYFFNRNKDYVFEVSYNIPSCFPNSLFLQVNIEQAGEELVEHLECCHNKNHKTNVIFSCNDIDISLRSGFQIKLDNQAEEMALKMKFLCNNTCTSMFQKSMLKFVLCDSEKVHKELGFNIKISERSNRDQKKSQDKRGVSLDESIKIKEELETDNFLYSGEFKKQLPKLTDLSGPYPGIDIILGENNKKASGNEFFARVDEKIYFKVLRTSYTDEPLFLKMMVVDPKNLTKILKCCNKHDHKHDNSISHVIRTDHQSRAFVGCETGIHMEDRLAIKIPLNDIHYDFSCYFLCNNSCFFADKKDTTTALIFTFENVMGQIVGRKTFYYKIVERPSRCKFTSSKERNTPKRKYSEDESSSSSESKISRQL